MEESISGFKQRGSWGDIVEHGERITRALRDVGVDGDALAEWDDWRPKAHERLHEDVNEKTADKASVAEGKGEQEGASPDEDIQEAGKKLSESYDQVTEGDTGGAVEKWQDSIDHVARAADSAGRKALRRVEDTVYRRVMTKLSPYYFDNELVSANLERLNRGNGDAFSLEVNVNDDDLKDEVSELLAEYEDDIDRWHVTTEKETETAEAAEGVPEPEVPDDDTRSTTN
jgi:hypothetical protein